MSSFGANQTNILGVGRNLGPLIKHIIANIVPVKIKPASFAARVHANRLVPLWQCHCGESPTHSKLTHKYISTSSPQSMYYHTKICRVVGKSQYDFTTIFYILLIEWSWRVNCICLLVNYYHYSNPNSNFVTAN